MLTPLLATLLVFSLGLLILYLTATLTLGIWFFAVFVLLAVILSPFIALRIAGRIFPGGDLTIRGVKEKTEENPVDPVE